MRTRMTKTSGLISIRREQEPDLSPGISSCTMTLGVAPGTHCDEQTSWTSDYLLSSHVLRATQISKESDLARGG